MKNRNEIRENQFAVVPQAISEVNNGIQFSSAFVRDISQMLVMHKNHVADLQAQITQLQVSGENMRLMISQKYEVVKNGLDNLRDGIENIDKRLDSIDINNLTDKHFVIYQSLLNHAALIRSQMMSLYELVLG